MCLQITNMVLQSCGFSHSKHWIAFLQLAQDHAKPSNSNSSFSWKARPFSLNILGSCCKKRILKSFGFLIGFYLFFSVCSFQSHSSSGKDIRLGQQEQHLQLRKKFKRKIQLGVSLTEILLKILNKWKRNGLAIFSTLINILYRFISYAIVGQSQLENLYVTTTITSYSCSYLTKIWKNCC